jgi:hypothetical protein
MVCLVLVGGCGTSGVGTDIPDGGQAGSGGAGGAAGSGNHMTEDGFNPSNPSSGSGVAGTGATANNGLLGSWVYASGTTTRTCPGEAPSVAPPLGGLNIAAAGAGEVTVTEACALRFKLAGKVATIVAGQSCAGSDGAGGQIAFAKMEWTLTLSSDGRTLAESLSADQILTPASGPARTCRYTEANVTLRHP